MFLHLGRDIVVEESTIIAVLDMDTATASRHTQAFLNNAEKQGRLHVITSELPKSAVVCREGDRDVVYISQLSSKTLLGRAEA